MNQRGVAIYLAIVIMFIILGIGLALSTILIGQIRMVRGMGDSVVALYAADTGIERVLYAIRKQGYTPAVGEPCGTTFDTTSFDCPPFDINNDGTPDVFYTIKIISTSPFQINSIGEYQKVKRAIEVTF